MQRDRSDAVSFSTQLRRMGVPACLLLTFAAGCGSVEPAPQPSPTPASAASIPAVPDSPELGPLFRRHSAHTYVLQQGDTIASVAHKLYGDFHQVSRILELNPDLDPRQLRVGQEIVLPAAADDGEAHAVSAALDEPPAHVPAEDSLSDLLAVTTRTIELRGQLELARAESDRLAELGKQGAADAQSVRIADVKLRVLQQQVDVADRLLRGELENAEAHLAQLQNLFDAGRLAAGDGRLQALRLRVEVLRAAK